MIVTLPKIPGWDLHLRPGPDHWFAAAVRTKARPDQFRTAHCYAPTPQQALDKLAQEVERLT